MYFGGGNPHGYTLRNENPHNYSYHVTEISRCGDLACFFLVSLFSAECVTVITKYHLWIILDHYSPVSELDREDGRALF